MKYVNQPVIKSDAMALVTGKPVYLEDIVPSDCLIVKVLRSPYANALIENINSAVASKVPGIVGVYTYSDVSQKRFTMAGQTYPEPSPYDRLILDKHVRYVGDPVAIVAGETEQAVDRALKMIKVKYHILEPLLDFRKSKDNTNLIHPEDNWRSLAPVGADNKRNLCASGCESEGDVDEVLKNCDIVVEGIYHTKACQQAMMEPFCTYCYIDAYGKLNVISSTQIVYHVRRIVAHALDIPQSKIRVTKPRIGGGFGAKQTVVSEVFPAFVTYKTGRPSKMIFTRTECQIASSPRHEMEVSVRIGATKDGKIEAIDVYTLSNTGAYGEHGPTTVGLSGHKSIPLYRDLKAFKFKYDVVYTNKMSAGAYRGYGATQGIFAVECAVNELAAKLKIDPIKLREMNMVQEGDIMPAYYGEKATSCALSRCVERCKKMIGWDEKYPMHDMGNGKVRSVGIAMAMQGSGIANVDVGSASIKLNDEGNYTLSFSSADMGTGCDTILAQIAAETLMCDMEDISICAADTAATPYDSGSYASSTTYVTGKATEKAALALVEKIKAFGAKMLMCDIEDTDFDGKKVQNKQTGKSVSINDIAVASMCGNCDELVSTVTNSMPSSPPPFMAGAVEIELDKGTGHVEILDYCAAVDCGTPINPNLARVQTEGGIVQGIGMALYENVTYNNKGAVAENSLMQYKIPTRMDMGKLHVVFESSYEQSGPYGAKSIGEIVVNTPSPAIAHAIYNATGIWFKELPITSEKIAMALINK